jgi:hypothetical protein
VARVEDLDGTQGKSVPRRRLRVAHAPLPDAGANELVEVFERRRVMVTRLCLWSVAKVAVVFWTCVGVLAVAAVFVVWMLLASAGVVGNFEEFIIDMTGVEDFRVLSGTVTSALVLLVCLGVVVAVVLTVVAAEFYNVVARALGGIEVIALEETTQWIPASSTTPPSSRTSTNGQHPDGVASNGHADGDVVLKS